MPEISQDELNEKVIKHYKWLSREEEGERLIIKANLSGANLSGTCLKGAYYNEKTIFPVDFKPKEYGMIFIKEDT